MRGDVRPQHTKARSVAELARDPGWHVVTGAGGLWITAETAVEHDGRRWRIGLTPVATDLVALILWEDSAVVGHVRGSEEAMCARAERWRHNLAAGLSWNDTTPRR